MSCSAFSQPQLDDEALESMETYSQIKDASECYEDLRLTNASLPNFSSIFGSSTQPEKPDDQGCTTEDSKASTPIKNAADVSKGSLEEEATTEDEEEERKLIRRGLKCTPLRRSNAVVWKRRKRLRTLDTGACDCYLQGCGSEMQRVLTELESGTVDQRKRGSLFHSDACPKRASYAFSCSCYMKYQTYALRQHLESLSESARILLHAEDCDIRDRILNTFLID